MSETPETAKPDETPAVSSVATETAPPPASSGALRRYVSPALLIAVIALALGGWQWYDSRRELAAVKQELAKRLADSDTQSKESRLVTEQVREAMSEAQVKLGVLEARIADSQN